MSASRTKMGDLHEAVAQELASRIADGSATAQDMSNAIKFLKDNGIEADRESNDAINSLASKAPRFDDELDGQQIN